MATSWHTFWSHASFQFDTMTFDTLLHLHCSRAIKIILKSRIGRSSRSILARVEPIDGTRSKSSRSIESTNIWCGSIDFRDSIDFGVYKWHLLWCLALLTKNLQNIRRVGVWLWWSQSHKAANIIINVTTETLKSTCTMHHTEIYNNVVWRSNSGQKRKLGMIVLVSLYWVSS